MTNEKPWYHIKTLHHEYWASHLEWDEGALVAWGRFGSRDYPRQVIFPWTDIRYVEVFEGMSPRRSRPHSPHRGRMMQARQFRDGEKDGKPIRQRGRFARSTRMP